MIILYDKICNKPADFLNNGIGILRDAFNVQTAEELNGELTTSFEYPLQCKYIDFIENENIIKVDVGTDEKQLFRIKNTSRGLSSVKVYAEHITYDLLDNLLEDTFPQNLTGGDALDWILSHTQYQHNFAGNSNITKTGSARYVRKNPLNAIIGDIDNSFVNVWGGELERNNFQIKMLRQRGEDTGYILKYGKNITGLDYTIDNSDVITRIMPMGYNGLLLPEKYVDSPIIDQYPFPKIKLVEFSDVKVKENAEDEEGFETIEEAYEELRKLCELKYQDENIDKPTVNLKVDFVDLRKTTAYSKYSFLQELKLGDTVTVKIDKINVKIRVIKTTHNGNRFTKLELGEFKENYITNTDKNIQNTVKEETKDISTTILEQAQSSATEQLINAMGGNIHKTRSELFIMDTDNPNTCQKVWRFNINGWGYSKNGINGPYEIAATMDGSLVASMIKTGVLSADRIHGGSLTLGGNNNYSGVFSLLNELAEEVIRMDNRGIILSNGAKLIGGNGVLSTFIFAAKSNFNDFLGYVLLNDADFGYYRINAYIPENFVITEAKVILTHIPVQWVKNPYTSPENIWGYSRNIDVFKVTKKDYPRTAYIQSSLIDIFDQAGLLSTNCFGANGYTPSVPSDIEHKQEVKIGTDIKNYIDKGNTEFIIKTRNAIVEGSSDRMYSDTGTGFAYLQVTGYMS